MLKRLFSEDNLPMTLSAILLSFIAGVIVGHVYLKKTTPLCQDSYGLRHNEKLACYMVGD